MPAASRVRRRWRSAGVLTRSCRTPSRIGRPRSFACAEPTGEDGKCCEDPNADGHGEPRPDSRPGLLPVLLCLWSCGRYTAQTEARREAIMASEHLQNHMWLSPGLAFVAGYADAAGFLLAHTFTGHVTGNLVLTAISVAHEDWPTFARRLLAIALFLAGIPAASSWNGALR